MLFLAYLSGMALALLLNVTHQRAFCLRLFYATVITSAHFYLLPPNGIHFYADCGIAQFLILVAALAIRCEAALPIAGMALVAVLMNLACYLNFQTHNGLWSIYYPVINAVQVFQILCLLFVSPVTIPFIRKLLSKKKEDTWMLRLLEI